MQPIKIFVVQFVLSIFAWVIIARWFVISWIKTRSDLEVLPILIIPQLFRHIGATLLVPGVAASSLPPLFAVSTAYGDIATALLAMLSVSALVLRWKRALTIVWIFNIFGSLDMVHSLIQGARLKVAPHLGAAWVVPTFVVPMMLTIHFLVFYTLVREQTSKGSQRESS